MLRHDFLLIKSGYHKNDPYIETVLSLFYENGLNPDLCYIVSDPTFIYLYDFLKDVKCELANGLTDQRIDYHGRNKITYNDLQLFIDNINDCIEAIITSREDLYVESGLTLINKNVSINELSNLIKFITYAIENDYFILHLGI